jgi:TRAP-type C4-dicarboxylate transport system permease small subunit
MNIPLLNISTWFIFKILILIALIVYLAFSLMVVRQVRLMTETLKVKEGSAIKTISYFYLALAVGILLLALIVL